MNMLTETGWAGGPVGEPALAGEVTCDVAVVGGGVGGMTAALRLADSGACLLYTSDAADDAPRV